MFCILCLCIILRDTSTASEKLTFLSKQSHSVECFCCHGYLLSGCHERKIKYSVEQITLDLFQNFDVSEEVLKCSFCPEVDLNDDAVW